MVQRMLIATLFLVLLTTAWADVEAGDNSEKGNFKINASKKHIDLDITEGNDKGKQQPGHYEFKDGTLRIGLAMPGEKERPAKLEDGQVQFEFEKVKK
jgi:uncharacterized protein (TIGR03067 family)